MLAGNQDTTPVWQDLLRHSCGGDHFAQVYQDDGFLADAIGEYVGSALRAGEAALVIATAAHRRLLEQRLEDKGLSPKAATRRGQLRLLDAAESLAGILQDDGEPDAARFHERFGALIAELRLQYPTVRAHGEMVDLLWQQGRRDSAIRLEELWNELAGRQSFSLLCSYRVDNLDSAAYGGALERVCKAHTHFIPARDYGLFNQAVTQASKDVLDQPLAQMLLSLSANHRPTTHMPLGQATLFWLTQNMPRTAAKVLLQVRAQLA